MLRLGKLCSKKKKSNFTINLPSFWIFKERKGYSLLLLNIEVCAFEDDKGLPHTISCPTLGEIIIEPRIRCPSSMTVSST